MTAERIRDLILESLAEEVARRVIEKLVARQKRALVVYTGSRLGFDSALECLARLRGEGFVFTVLLSENARAVLDRDRIAAALRPEALIEGQPEQPAELLAASFDTVIVPALSANTTAHLAACMADTPAARVILNAMMRGKNVVVAVDGCCPDNPERIAKGYRMTDALSARLRANIDILQSYGATLARATSLDRAAMRAVSAQYPSAKSERQAGNASRQVHAGSLVSRGDIAGLAPNSVLAVAPGCLVTQLARDLAAQKGIVIAES